MAVMAGSPTRGARKAPFASLDRPMPQGPRSGPCFQTRLAGAWPRLLPRRPIMLKRVLALSAVLALTATGVAAQPGNAADPIVIKMKRGTDSVRLVGVLRQNAACCTYAFK